VGFFGWVFCCQPCLVEEDEDLLVGEAVEGAGQAAHAGREGEVGVGQGRAHQVGGVGRHVPALVVAEDRQHQIRHRQYASSTYRTVLNCFRRTVPKKVTILKPSVADPDPYVFGPPDP
jgi:hypothetical protein